MDEGLTTQLFAAMVAMGGMDDGDDSGPPVSTAAVAALFGLVDGVDVEATSVHPGGRARSCRKDLRRALEQSSGEARRTGRRELAAELEQLAGLARQLDWALRIGPGLQ